MWLSPLLLMASDLPKEIAFMSNFIVIGPRGNISATCHAVFGEIYKRLLPNAHYISSRIPTGIEGFFYRLFLRRKLRPFLPKRLIFHWEVKYRDVAPFISKDDENYIIFCPATRATDRITPMLLQDLRKHNPECKLIFYFIDGFERVAGMSRITTDELHAFLKNFDAAYTYDRLDSEKYNLPFLEIPIWISHTPPSSQLNKELYFCGRDKGRVDLLLKIYDRLHAVGLRCDYRIEKSGEVSYQREGIRFTDWATYDQIADEVLDTNCILEILANNNHGATLRYKEAVIYNKKLLTTNPEITQLPYYDPRWMRYFETAEDIDLEWLRAVEPVDYHYKGDFSAQAFLNSVEKKYTNTH